MKCLECAINPLLHSLSGSASNRGILAIVCFKWRAFSKQELILSSIVLVTLKEWLVLRNKLNYSDTKIGEKVQPHQPSVLIV